MDNIVTLGVKLENLRNEKGLTQKDIAKKIHICTNVIDDIEHGELSRIPVVFIRGYIRSYAEIVGLPLEEYHSFLEALSKNHCTYKMKDYSQINKSKKRGKWLLIISILIIMTVLGITAYCVWQENRDNFIEVSHYISPEPTNHISS
ncbi:helix-turn-helix domain-containing protein [Orbaceae bacterium ESL0721]|nr:helix-turn-helix domain-containing protein [Orbaceae bacterium ESL0721]